MNRDALAPKWLQENVLGFEESSTTVIKEPEHTHSPPAQSVTVIGIVVCRFLNPRWWDQLDPGHGHWHLVDIAGTTEPFCLHNAQNVMNKVMPKKVDS